jgi:sugar O-acyltransferase (sialic acid O-acetyltransferase NeuD family)
LNPNSGARSVVLIGGGGHARVCADIARAAGWTILGMCDLSLPENSQVDGITVIHEEDQNLAARFGPQVALFVAIGRQYTRSQIVGRLIHAGSRMATLVHPAAVLAPSASVGPGSCVMAGAVLNNNARAGAGVIVNSNATVEHDCVLDDYVHVSPGATLTGNVHCGGAAFVGAGAVVVQGRRIGAASVIAAGAVVTEDIPPNMLVAGVPARRKRAVPKLDDPDYPV